MIPATKEDHAQLTRWLTLAKFGRDIGPHIVPYASDVVPEENDRGGRNANNWRMVCSAVVQPEWCNGFNSLHGAASAWIVDVMTSVALARLSTPTFWGPPMLAGVTIQLDMTYYNPCPV